MTSDNNYISQDSEWSFELIERFEKEIDRIAKGYGLDTYANQIEVITSEQMMDAYAAVGMPVGYHHWSYGKHFISTQTNYQRGNMGLAYEIVINSDPCIAYLMEENTLMMQALVIAHACYGHNSFFKGNYLFKTWTDAQAIIDYLLFAKNYIKKCEEKYGLEEVEKTLDACHALMNYGVDRYKRPEPISASEELNRQQERADILQQQVNDLWRTLPKRDEENKNQQQRFPQEPQENILYFIEKHAPVLKPWQREIVRIVRKMAQYFYPQKQTQVMNEGWATFWHYTIMNTLYDEGLINDAYMIEFLSSHTNVVAQQAFDSPYYNGINPYALGFSMFQDIKRICQEPTEEDKYWFADIAGSDWQETLQFAMRNFKDESFILQFLSPKLIRDFKLFNLFDDDKMGYYHVDAIHNEQGYRTIRENLASQYDLSKREPNIQVFDVDLQGDRSMTLQHQMFNESPLDKKDSEQVLKHLHYLWGFDVHLFSLHSDKIMADFHCPELQLDMTELEEIMSAHSG